jgi:CelD/BcsL family acetyltransferase involved in cellulose biosynthesis
MDDLLRLHRLRWAAEGGSDGIPSPAVEAFHREVAPLLAARGWLRIYRLLVEGKAIAAVYGIEVGRRFFYYQSGYDPAWSARSPGVVLVGKTGTSAGLTSLVAGKRATVKTIDLFGGTGSLPDSAVSRLLTQL